VFDASHNGLDVGIIATVVGGAIIGALIAGSQFRSGSKSRATLAITLVCGWLLLAGALAVLVNHDRLQCAQWARGGEYSTIDGVVRAFHPMPQSGHDSERFTVNGVAFAYSDYQPTGGFNNAASHGGPIREGLRVRIGYRGTRILKLWVADSR
jgi:hypothetical protein